MNVQERSDVPTFHLNVLPRLFWQTFRGKPSLSKTEVVTKLSFLYIGAIDFVNIRIQPLTVAFFVFVSCFRFPKKFQSGLHPFKNCFIKI